jgi:hypothetical protein
MTDDLSAPLGLPKPAKRPRKLTFAQLHVLAGALGLSTVFLTGWMFLADKPVSRAPLAGAHIQTPENSAAPAVDADLRVIRLSPDDRPNRSDGVRIEASPAAASPSRTITNIDGTSGRSQEVQIPISADEVLETSAIDPVPIGTSRSVPVPRSAANGSRPADLNARAVKRNPGKPETP